MFLHIARWSALSALLILGATVSATSLQAQQTTTADPGNASTQGLTVAATAAPSTTIRTAPVSDPYLPLSDPLLVPFGITTAVPASPLALSMAPKQDDGVHLGANLALMGVGAAGLVVGLIMNNDLGTGIAVGGGAVFLIGFYRWLS